MFLRKPDNKDMKNITLQEFKEDLIDMLQIINKDDGFDPPPWEINEENKDKTFGWIERQKWERSNNGKNV